MGAKGLIRFLVDTGQRSDEWAAELTRRKNEIVKFNDAFRAEWKIRLLDHIREAA